MKLTLTSDIELDSSAEGRFVTWFDVTAREGDAVLAHARIALVHVGEIADDHGDVWRALRAAGIEYLHDTYFDQGWFKDEFADGAGLDLLYVAELDVDARFAGRNLDLALLRRVSQTLGSGCQLVVMPYKSALEAAHWSPVGFEISTPGRSRGLLHLKLGLQHAPVVDTSGDGSYEVLGASFTESRPRRVGFGNFQS